MMPTKTTLKTIAWTLGTLVVLNQFDQTRGVVTGPGKRFI